MALYRLSDAPKWIATFTVDVGSLSANTTSDETLATGYKPARVNDLVVVWAPALETGLVLSPTVVTTAGTVKVRIGNITGSPINPGSQTFIAVGL